MRNAAEPALLRLVISKIPCHEGVGSPRMVTTGRLELHALMLFCDFLAMPCCFTRAPFAVDLTSVGIRVAAALNLQ